MREEGIRELSRSSSTAEQGAAAEQPVLLREQGASRSARDRPGNQLIRLVPSGSLEQYKVASEYYASWMNTFGIWIALMTRTEVAARAVSL